METEPRLAITDGEEDGVPVVDTPLDMRPDLAELGIFEHEKGVCEDTYENRSILRRAKLEWDSVYDGYGRPTNLIAARSKEATYERRIIGLAEKRVLLVDPTKNNSDYMTGLELLLDDDAAKAVPPWVLGATRKWHKQQLDGLDATKQTPVPLPHRCSHIKTDGLRCLLWASGLARDGGLCKSHMKSARTTTVDIERARKKIMQSAPYAVDVLEDLMMNAQSEPVRMKSATEILDRAGIRGGVEVDVTVDHQGRSPAEIVSERLRRLQEGAVQTIEILPPETDVHDAEVVVPEYGPRPEEG